MGSSTELSELACAEKNEELPMLVTDLNQVKQNSFRYTRKYQKPFSKQISYVGITTDVSLVQSLNA